MALAGHNDATKTFFNVKDNEDNDQLIRIWVMSPDASFDVVFTVRVKNQFLVIRPLKEDNHFGYFLNNRRFEYQVDRNHYLESLNVMLDIQAPVEKEAAYYELSIKHHFNSSITFVEHNNLYTVPVSAVNEFENHDDELNASYNHAYVTDFLRCYPRKTTFTLVPTGERNPMFITPHGYGSGEYEDTLVVMPVVI
jgi:hypothetical protein